MQDFERAIETRKNEMLSEYPQQQALTILVMDAISDMLHSDFEAITQKSKKQQLIFRCAAEVLEKLRDENVRKKYATDVLGIFLDHNIVSYINSVLGADGRYCISVIKAAQSHLYASQWSDPSSRHWQAAISCFAL